MADGGFDVVPIQPRNEIDRDLLGARRHAFAVVRARPEPLRVHLRHQVHHPGGALGLTLGSSPRCDTLAATNNIAEALGQAATQAPHPMHAAASIARSASRFGTGIAFASGALPVRTVMKPPAWTMRSKAPRSTTRSLMRGKALARHGSIHRSAPSGKVRMCS